RCSPASGVRTIARGASPTSTADSASRQRTAYARPSPFALVDKGSLADEAHRKRFGELHRAVLAASEARQSPKREETRPKPKVSFSARSATGPLRPFTGVPKDAAAVSSGGATKAADPEADAVRWPVLDLLCSDLFASEPGEHPCRAVALRVAG